MAPQAAQTVSVIVSGVIVLPEVKRHKFVPKQKGDQAHSEGERSATPVASLLSAENAQRATIRSPLTCRNGTKCCPIPGQNT